MYALQLQRCAHACTSRIRSCLYRASVTRAQSNTPRCNSSASSPGSSTADWQTEMDASLFKLVAQARDKLYFAAGQVALDQPVSLFFSKYQKQEGPQADLVAAPALPVAGQASFITFPLNRQSSSSNSSGSRVDGLIAAAKPLLRPLLDAAAPSSFGRGKESVYDPSFRSALELPASHMALNIPHPPADVLQQIQTLLQPDAVAVVADFYKLNIYGPGGFFKPHFDTPRSSDMFGSLVVCLPSPHSGGGLVLRHKSRESSEGISHCFDWSTAQQTGSASAAVAPQGNSQQEQLGSLQWAAFYSDSEHEVLPVTDGYRITLTYNLRAVGESSTNGVTNSAPAANADSEPFKKDAGEVEEHTDASISTAGAATSFKLAAAAAEANAAAVPPDASGIPGDTSWLTATDIGSSAPLVGHIKTLLADKKWHPEGDTLGFVLTHRYARDLASLGGLPFPAALKGPDRLLWAALAQAGLQPKVLPMFRSWNGPAEYEYCVEKDSSWEEDSENEASGDEDPPEPRVLQPVHVAPPPENAIDLELLRKGFPKKKFRWELTLSKWGSARGGPGVELGDWHEEPTWDEQFSISVQEVYGCTPADGIHWITPVNPEDFQYADRFLGGGNEPCEMAFYASAVLLVKVPAWSERKP